MHTYIGIHLNHKVNLICCENENQEKYKNGIHFINGLSKRYLHNYKGHNMWLLVKNENPCEIVVQVISDSMSI